MGNLISPPATGGLVPAAVRMRGAGAACRGPAFLPRVSGDAEEPEGTQAMAYGSSHQLAFLRHGETMAAG